MPTTAVQLAAVEDQAHRFVSAPPLRLQLSEGRSMVEAAWLGWTWPALSLAPRGDGHHVVVFPGFNTSDRSTRLLRRYLTGLGYVVHGWDLGRNVGPTAGVLTGMDDLVTRVTDEAGGPVSLIGWSLGGLYARELARERPDLVRYVATLGSPFRMRPGDSSTASFLAAKYGRNFDDSPVPPREETRDRLTMPTTAIYSRTDGFVRWQLCVDDATDSHENVRVRGSHMGLVVNPLVLSVLADRLSRVSEGGEWSLFRPPAALRPWYPAAKSWVSRAV